MNAQLISSMKVVELFGLYTYTLPADDVFDNAAILYGDNGVGKSTILRIAFHLLSAAGNRGHRTALSKANFKRFEITLGSGTCLCAIRREKDDAQSITLSLSKNSVDLAIWEYHPGARHLEETGEFYTYIVKSTQTGISEVRRKAKPAASKELASVPRGEEAYLTALKEHAPTVFILTADRRLDSDSIPDPSDEVELRRVMRFEEPKRINDLVIRSREIALSQSLSAASRWISRRALQGANQGSMNVHTVYTDVLNHLLTAPTVGSQAPIPTDVAQLITRLSAIESQTKEYARYELATPLAVGELKKALNTKAKKKKQLVANLLEPYIASLESRLAALDPIYRIVDTFVNLLNSLLQDKSISFTPGQGFVLKNALQSVLEPAQLSSGEQQLLLLFCYVLTGRDQPSVFMIDEPEISLNVKWQRHLINSLLKITEGAKIQFIFASHSLELLAQHRNRVVKLTSKA